MRTLTRAAGIASAFFTLALLITPLSAGAFWSGFPFGSPQDSSETAIEVALPFEFCHTISAAGLSISFKLPSCDKEPPPPPPPVDVCPNVPGMQESGPCADEVCEDEGGTWDGDSCEFPPPPETTLTLMKTVVNDNGGTATADNFQAMINGGNVPWGVAQVVSAGAHTASETGTAGYSAGAWGGDCAADGSITLVEGEDATCTITNDDQPGTLSVIKVLINDDGGTAATTTFSFAVNGAATTTFEADGQNDIAVNAGTYTVREVEKAGYATSYNNCTNVAVANGETKVCTITNNDIAPEPDMPLLTVTKVVVNDNGGTMVVGNFPLFVGSTTVTSGEQNSFEAGQYTVSETGNNGYTATFSGNCASNGTITLENDGVYTCTITNNDKQGTLSVVKVVINDSGGTATTTDFSFQINGTSTTAFEADGQNDVEVNAGTYTVTEVAAEGYTTSYENCENVQVANGETKVCTITNNDIAPEPEGKLLITEVLYDLTTSTTSPQGDEPSNEWVEIYNGTNSTINLSDFSIADASSTDPLPDVELPAGAYAIITPSGTTTTFWEFPEGTVVVILNSSIGSNGLGNEGDIVSLIENEGGTTVDAVSWGENTTAFSPSVTDVPANVGSSIERIDHEVDTDSANDWEEREAPTPGE